MKIAVIAGTPVDTQMGVELLKSRGAEALGFPISRTPEEQTAFQVGSQSAREAAVGAVLENIKIRGMDRVLLYCNSLSATIDAHGLAEGRGLRIWTPMDVYGEIALQYRRIGVLAANCQGGAAAGAGRRSRDAAGGAGGGLRPGASSPLLRGQRGGGGGAGLHPLPLCEAGPGKADKPPRSGPGGAAGGAGPGPLKGGNFQVNDYVPSLWKTEGRRVSFSRVREPLGP